MSKIFSGFVSLAVLLASVNALAIPITGDAEVIVIKVTRHSYLPYVNCGSAYEAEKYRLHYVQFDYYHHSQVYHFDTVESCVRVQELVQDLFMRKISRMTFTVQAHGGYVVSVDARR